MKELLTKEGDIVWVDDEDYPILSRYKVSTINDPKCRTKYARIKINKEGIGVHKIVLGLPVYDSRITDHINGNGMDNRKCNLRICTHAENMRNRRKNKNSKSRFKGVILENGSRKIFKKDGSYRIKKRKRWRASIRFNGKNYRKRASNEIEAAKKYDEMAKKLHGEFALLNFPYGAPDEDKSYFENGKQSQLNL